MLIGNEEFIGLSEVEFARCRKSVREFIICPKFLTEIIPHAISNNCIQNLLVNNSTQACEYEKSRAKTSYVETEKNFVISSVANLEVKVKCKNKRIVNSKLSSTGLGIFPSSCGLKSKIFNWQKIEEVGKEVHVKLHSKMPEIKINLQKNHTLSKLISSVEEEVKKSELLLLNTPEEENYYLLHRNVINTYVPISSLIIVALAIALAVVICKNKIMQKRVEIVKTERPSEEIELKDGQRVVRASKFK